MHRIIEPSILYFGTPVILISTRNENGTYNVAPMSSVFWLGWHCMLGLAASSKTTQNMIQTGECVLNLVSVNEVAAVNRLALTTGSYPVPESKQCRGYRFESDKFGVAGLTSMPSDTVAAPRVRECPVQLEAIVEAVHSMAEKDSAERGRFIGIEVRILRIHADEEILMGGEQHRIDPDKWRPLMMSFQRLYGLGSPAYESVLATVPESVYGNPAEKGHPI
ncbi:flavin reductase family protein [Acidiferrobacter thiooxydans]|uniref:Flavin reductase family protein n=2 Tax=Acidiferrobacter thiooxydans TaxID=163359 RepID=A0A1C2FYG3_9GAMM|nr:flavin reductase family protein [Acidiferrobacter thiooxydans]RCN57163.1 flavin reductase family protein [Acidiferrobacter thiooxydans]